MKRTTDSASSIFRWVTTFNAVFLLLSVSAFSQVSREEALTRVYPGAAIQAERVFLTPEQARQSATLAGHEMPTQLVARYTATVGGQVVGRAYVDTHQVRTKNQSLLICLDAAGRVQRVEVTAFLEPPEYQASEAWYGQFRDKTLTGDLNMNRAIRPIAGATLTGLSTTRAVRRVLAIDAVLTGGRKD